MMSNQQQRRPVQRHFEWTWSAPDESKHFIGGYQGNDVVLSTAHTKATCCRIVNFLAPLKGRTLC